MCKRFFIFFPSICSFSWVEFVIDERGLSNTLVLTYATHAGSSFSPHTSPQARQYLGIVSYVPSCPSSSIPFAPP
jgi:hypothetical protein